MGSSTFQPEPFWDWTAWTISNFCSFSDVSSTVGKRQNRVLTRQKQELYTTNLAEFSPLLGSTQCRLSLLIPSASTAPRRNSSSGLASRDKKRPIVTVNRAKTLPKWGAEVGFEEVRKGKNGLTGRGKDAPVTRELWLPQFPVIHFLLCFFIKPMETLDNQWELT